MLKLKSFLSPKIVCLVVALLFLFCMPVFANRRILNIAIVTLMYILMGQSWNVLSGMAGMFNIVPSMFFGLGAYCMTLTTYVGGANWFVGVLVGFAVNAAMASLVGFIGSKLSGLYFTMALIGLFQTIFAIFIQWGTLTGGYMGISMPKQYLLTKPQQYYIILGLVLLAMALFMTLRRSRIGTNFVALKENPELAISLGSNIHAWRILATIISACMASTAGAFYAFFLMATTPNVFASTISLKTMMVVMIGGVGHVFGPVLGSFMIVLDEIVRGMMPSRFAAFSVIIYAAVLILMTLLRPRGLITIFDKSKGMDIGKTLLDAFRVETKNPTS